MPKSIQIGDLPDDIPPLADILAWATEREWGVPAGEAVALLRGLRDQSSAA